MEQTKYDVFISYSRKDYVKGDVIIPNNPITAIQKLFEEKGISYWIDKDGIYIGEEFVKKISRAIVISKMLVFISSKNSNVSEYTCGEILKAEIEEMQEEAQRIAEETRRQEEMRSAIYTVNGVSFRMIRVEGGTFMMGATPEQGSEACYDEKPVYQVTLSDYYIGETQVTQVTQALWQAVMDGDNPSRFKGANRHVENVSWDDCHELIGQLNKQTGISFRLPTEAEWEFAAHGGKKRKGYKYSDGNNLSDAAWFGDNSNGETKEVKTKSANELGLYDMSGNVWEWCNDWYDGTYPSSPQINPQEPSSGSYPVLRGGSWRSIETYYRTADHRYRYTPSGNCSRVGLRLTQ